MLKKLGMGFLSFLIVCSFFAVPLSGKLEGCFDNVSLTTYAANVSNISTVSNFKAAAKSDNVKLTWNKVSGAYGYIVYRYDTSKKSWGKIATIRSNSYTAKKLNSGTEYKFAVKAYKTVRGKTVTSASYPQVTVVTNPAVVSGFKASTVSASAVKLTWNKVSNADGYVVYKYDNAQKTWVRVAKTIVNINTYTVSNLSSYTSYKFAVKAYKTANGKEIMSESFPQLTVTTKLAAVKDLKFSSVSESSIKLTWSKVLNAQGYVVYKYDSSKKTWVRVTKTSTAVNAYTIDKLNTGTTYSFAVKAYKTVNGKEIFSESYEPIKAVVLYSSVKNLSVVLSDSRARLNWDKLNNADGYKIYLYSNNKWSLYGQTTKVEYTNKYLSSGTSYKFGVRAYKIVDNQEVLSQNITTVESSTIPSSADFTYENVGDSLKLSWTNVRGADEYIVYTKLPGEEWKRQGITTSLSYTIKNISYPKYYVTVKAVRNYNGKAYSGNYIKKLVHNENYNGKLYSDGDSIAYGSGAFGYSYAFQYAEKYTLDITSKAVPGATISSGVADKSHIAESIIKNVSSKYDYIFLEGGVNDYYTSAKLGNITSAGTTEFDMNTTCGALESALYYVKNNCPDSHVYFVSIHNVNNIASKKNSIGLTYSDYRNAIEKICKKYGVTVIDCYNESGFNTENESLKFNYTYKGFGVYPDGDGLHPTESGYREFYMPIIERTILKNESKD